MATTVEGAIGATASPENFASWTEELLNLEIKAEEEETTLLLQTLSHNELQARGIALLKLNIVEQGSALYGRVCLVLERQGGGPLPAHRIGNGDIVGLFDQSARPLSKAVPMATAVVQSVKSGSISIVFDGDVPIEVLETKQLNLATVSSDVTMKRYREALDVLKSGRVEGPANGLAQVCFGDEDRPRFKEKMDADTLRPDAVDCTFRAEQTHKLNEPQQAAIEKALCAMDIAIVHGPPGTGKTTTLVAYILEAVYRKQKLLVTAPSNVAVDNLLERLVDCGVTSVVRLGHPSRVQSELHKFTMDNVVYKSDQAALCRDIKKEIDDALKIASSGKSKKVEAKAARGEVTALRKELRKRERSAVAEVLRSVQVVFATCAGAATLHREIRKNTDAGKSLVFDVVVIDEAAQALEVACWIPMLLGKKAILAGDHQQLSACVKSTEAQKKGLDRTLFGRMIEKHGDHVAALLSIQYRMNDIIMGWSSQSFYDSRLTAAESVASRTLDLQEVPESNLTGDILEMLSSPLLFVDTCSLPLYREDEQQAGADVKSSAAKAAYAAVHQSRWNKGESRFTVHYAKMLVRCGISPRNITVIAPYSRQVEQLRLDFADDAETEKLGLDKMRVNTVDSFQGQEADCVLISLVRSNDRGSVGFLSDYRRLNVAVTRGRKHVMLIGDAATISTDDMLHSLYTYACESGRVAFVEQLLDEDGAIPADPASISAPAGQSISGSSRAKNNKGSGKGQGPEKLKDEQEVRKHMLEKLSALAVSGGRLEFPASLNSFERAIAHEVAKSLGLHHESVGEDKQRRLCVWTDGFSGPSAAGSAAARKADQPAAAAQNSGPSAGANAVAAADDDDDDQETPLQAFERRAAATLDSLTPAEPVAEWKAPGEEEREILQRLAAARSLEVTSSGSGKKRKLRLSLPESEETRAAAAAAEAAAKAAKAAKATPPGATGTAAAAAAAAGTAAAPGAGGAARGNALLAGLHEARRKRQEEEAKERKVANEAVKADIKEAKRQGKEKQKAMTTAAEDDDLDALLSEFTSKDGICPFGNCKEKTHTLIDPVSKCKYCSLRFCMKHAQAEIHGCGDAAQRAEKQKFRDSHPLGARGSGLVNKPTENRSALADKLQNKIGGQAANRAKKGKDKD